MYKDERRPVSQGRIRAQFSAGRAFLSPAARLLYSFKILNLSLMGVA
jgi:hypothetical protein